MLRDPASLGLGADDYINDYWGRLRGAGGALVTSSLPLFVREGGRRRPVDLAVERDGSGLASARPLVAVRYPERADGPVRLGGSGVHVSAGGVHGSRAEAVDGRVVYADVGSDLDQVFAPTPTGFDVLWQLRSPAAPTTLPLRVSVPAGARLSLVDSGAAGAPQASGPPVEPGSAVVTKDGRVLATIDAPTATDAAGHVVATHYELDGDTLRTVVETAGRDLMFPLLVDPDVRDTYDGAHLAASGQWAFAQFIPGGSNGFAAGRLNNSLSVGALRNAYYVDGAQGYWLWRAPPGAALSSVVFTGITHAYVATQFFSGILNPAASGYEAGPFYYPYALSNASSLATSANPGEGNFAIAGLRMAGSSVRGASAFMYFGGATLTVRDNHPPVSSLRAIPSGNWTTTAGEGSGLT